MRVGLNATCLNNRPSGAKQRFVGIYSALARCLPNTEFVVFEPKDSQMNNWFEGLENVSVHATPIPSTGRVGKFTAGLLYWRQAFACMKLDVYEAMHLPLIRPTHGLAILTIHDVRGLCSDNGPIDRILFATVLRQALQKADHVVTVSEAMRSEILSFFPHKPVSVVYNGLNASMYKSSSCAACKKILAKYKLPSEFVLAVGHFERRKNYPKLINAIAILKRRGQTCSLVIAGNDSGEGAALLRQIVSLGLTNQVLLLNGLSDLEVRCLYRLCSLFVFPSAYEGFGIPILEAMASGRPMVLSDLKVFREITENQSMYFPHDDVALMADAIETGLTSCSAREQIVSYGFKRVADFSFERLAGDMVAVYEKCGLPINIGPN